MTITELSPQPSVLSPEAQAAQRQAVVAEALTWRRTPYHHGQAVKGAGVDCALFLAEVYHAAGLIPKIEFDYYPPDWHMHKNDERYLRHILAFASLVPGSEKREAGSENGCLTSCSLLPAPCSVALPGDVAMYKFGRCTAHGAIIVEWPVLIHSYIGDGVVLVEAASSKLAPHFQGIYRLKEWTKPFTKKEE